MVNDKTECSAYLVNDDIVKSIELAKDGSGHFDLELEDGLNTAKVIIYDEAKNERIKKLTVLKTNKDDFVVNIDNLSLSNFLSAESTQNDVFTIKGFVTNRNVSLFKIAGQDVNIKEDLSFEVPVTLKQGENKILIQAMNSEGRYIYNYSYRVYYDSINPEINLKTPVIREDGNIYVNDDEFELKGKVKENFAGYKLYVNGDVLLNWDKLVKKDKLEKDFSKIINLNNGLNKIELKLYDYSKEL